ncbi:MAG: 5,6-dimethylbenzimidazole synthase [Acidobacteriaceae bacterium]|nr:5,6-dimethylbenzimidazole synthase [Acidobacteriaceae bacterium]
MTGDQRFDAEFREQFRNLLRWRRDVRRFKPEPLPSGLLEEILELSRFAPSVGLSEPWRYVRISNPEIRAEIRKNFERANAQALSGYSGERAVRYARLKLAGLDSAPVHLAVFADHETTKGSGLGCRTMPEMREYSIVAAITTLWLAARAYGVGMGWLSILDPEEVRVVLSVPSGWHLVAYLCLGFPEQDSLVPELEEAGWEKRRAEILLLER